MSPHRETLKTWSLRSLSTQSILWFYNSETLHACYLWIQHCSSVQNSTGWFLSVLLNVFHKWYKGRRKISFTINRSLLAAHGWVLFMLWKVVNRKNMCKKSHREERIHRDRGKNSIEDWEVWMVWVMEHRKKIRTRMSHGEEEWNNFIKKEKFFVLIWVDSNLEQIMKRNFCFSDDIILEIWAFIPSSLDTGPDYTWQKMVCQSRWCYILP